jgi:hypothetical protein
VIGALGFAQDTSGWTVRMGPDSAGSRDGVMLQRRLVYEYQCDKRLKTKNEESTRLTYTGLVVELEHLKTKTRLKDEG